MVPKRKSRSQDKKDKERRKNGECHILFSLSSKNPSFFLSFFQSLLVGSYFICQNSCVDTVEKFQNLFISSFSRNFSWSFSYSLSQCLLLFFYSFFLSILFFFFFFFFSFYFFFFLFSFLFTLSSFYSSFILLFSLLLLFSRSYFSQILLRCLTRVRNYELSIYIYA